MQNHSYIVGLIKMGGNLDLAQELKFASPCAKKKKKKDPDWIQILSPQFTSSSDYGQAI